MLYYQIIIVCQMKIIKKNNYIIDGCIYIVSTVKFKIFKN